jgi:hypothetical protein
MQRMPFAVLRGMEDRGRKREPNIDRDLLIQQERRRFRIQPRGFDAQAGFFPCHKAVHVAIHITKTISVPYTTKWQRISETLWAMNSPYSREGPLGSANLQRPLKVIVSPTLSGRLSGLVAGNS